MYGDRRVRIYILYLRHVKMWRDVFCILDFILHLKFLFSLIKERKTEKKKTNKTSQTLNLGMPIFIPGISDFRWSFPIFFPSGRTFSLPFPYLDDVI